MDGKREISQEMNYAVNTNSTEDMDMSPEFYTESYKKSKAFFC